jgi:hypothetical protein
MLGLMCWAKIAHHLRNHGLFSVATAFSNVKLRVGFKTKQLSRLPVTDFRFQACESTVQAVENGTLLTCAILEWAPQKRYFETFGENRNNATHFDFFRIDFALIGLYKPIFSSSYRAALAAGTAGSVAFVVLQRNISISTMFRLTTDKAACWMLAAHRRQPHRRRNYLIQ